MPITGDIKVVAPGKRRKKEPKVETVKKVEEAQPSSLFVIKDSKYHQDMFNLDPKKSN